MSTTLAEPPTDVLGAFEWSEPLLAAPYQRNAQEAEWGVAAAVAAILGVSVAVVAYICSVCQARSFNACLNAVQNYWTRGC